MCRLLVLLALVAPFPSAQARIIKIIIDKVESPAFTGQSFGNTGRYEKLIGRAIGEVDPLHPGNAVITDIQLVPKDPEAYVQYETQFYLLKPIDPSKSNGLLFYSAPNRGDKRGFTALNQGLSSSNDPTNPGDGFAMRRGYTMLWSGWQADVVPGGDRLGIKVPVAKNSKGGDITGLVRMEYIPTSATAGWNFALYPPVEVLRSKATLTFRKKESDPRSVIPQTDWVYADCATKTFPGTPSGNELCLKNGFQTDFIYEFIYTAKDPYVLGLGFAATRDLVSFFKFQPQDDEGTPNPIYGAIKASIGEGQSQPGRFLRTFLALGFNEDEYGNVVFEGMNPQIASQGIPLNVRFGQPDRSMGQHENAMYPAPEGPLTWGPMLDPLAGRWASNMDVCRQSLTCPKLIQTISGTEFWQGRMSLNITNWSGKVDAELPPEMRLYHFAGTQHTPTTSASTGMCQNLQNPAPFFETRRALLVALEQWVLEGKEPPPSRYPKISDGTLVAPNSIGFPTVPGFRFNGVISGLTIRDFGPEFDSLRVSGATVKEPATLGSSYTMLAPKVDADGNEIGGIRSTTIQVPLGTYTGWALRRAGFAEDELCGLTGSYMPFKATKAERIAAGDPRLSIEERYRDQAAIAAAVQAAAKDLVKQGYLLEEDADRLIAAAQPK